MSYTFNDYQRDAMRTAPEPNLGIFTLGLVGEAGEVAELVKKHLGHGHALNVEKFKKELGDVLWYVAALAQSQGLSLADVAEANIAKLRAGFSREASKCRAVEVGARWDDLTNEQRASLPTGTRLAVPPNGAPLTKSESGSWTLPDGSVISEADVSDARVVVYLPRP